MHEDEIWNESFEPAEWYDYEADIKQIEIEFYSKLEEDIKRVFG